MQKTFEILKVHRQDVLTETMKKLTFICTQSQFMDKIMKNKKGVELITSLSLSCKICSDKFISWSDPLNLKTVERKGKTRKIFNISRMKRAFQRQDNEKFHFDFRYLQFKDLKSYLLKSIYFKSLNCK